MSKVNLVNFPENIDIEQDNFVNWSKEISIDNIWICSPRSPEEVTKVVNWAHTYSYKIKAKGASHNWSPLNISAGKDDKEKIIFIDTQKNLKKISLNNTVSPVTVTAEVGVTMDILCDFLEGYGYGFNSMPAPGELTLGGVLAINGHGTAVPATGEKRVTGQIFRSLSNAVLSLQAIVWDNTKQCYILRRFRRSEPECAVLLTSLGRIFITEVTLQVMNNSRLLCESFFDFTIDELLGKESDKSLSNFIKKSGRVEVIWFPFTNKSWLKVWTISPKKPLLVREVTSPYNYPITDNISEKVTDLISRVQNGSPHLTTTLGELQYLLFSSAVKVTLSKRIWGWSKNVLHYLKSTPLRTTFNGYAILTKKDNIQNIVCAFANKYSEMLEKYAEEGKYPINCPVEIRITGLDHSSDVDIPDASEPSFSALKSVAERPDLDCAVWFNVVTIPGSPAEGDFFAELEEWIYKEFDDDNNIVRVEWSKRWAYTQTGAWSNKEMIKNKIPVSYSSSKDNKAWNESVEKIVSLDPHGIFSTCFVNEILTKA